MNKMLDAEDIKLDFLIVKNRNKKSNLKEELEDVLSKCIKNEK